ncbi:MAG: hypothetical protein NC406_04400 [Bacteroides sp.]|nr:hypothetical protein [Bacteroides sp.]MCM1095309.1 hypothetical protein [Terasakiella sp.]
MRRFTLLTLAAAAMTAAAAPADSSYIREDGSRIVFSRTSPEMRRTLEKTRPTEPHAVSVPHFVVRSTNDKFILAIGGHINPIAGYDIGNDLYERDGAGLAFVTSQIPVPAEHGRRSDYFINPLNASLDFQIVGLAGTPNAITAYVRLGTDNKDASVRFKRAYVSYRDFTLGQVATLMQDADACQPPTIDPQGPCGIVGTTSYEISYRSPSYGGFRYAVGVDMPSYYSSAGFYMGRDYEQYHGEQVADVKNVEQMMPDIPVWVEYGRPLGRIRLSAMLRGFSYRDLVADCRRTVMGYGVMLSGNLYPCKPLILYGQVAYGRGFGNYLQDIAGMPLSFVPADDRPGRMKASPMMGWVAGATYNFSPRWQANVMFSQSRIWDVAEYCTAPDAAANYKYALYGAGNVFFNITSYLQVGLEYLWGRRVTWNEGGANDSRIQAQFKFTI